MTPKERLEQWLLLHTIGRRPRSVEFNREIHAVILPLLPASLEMDLQQVLDVGTRLAHYCPSRWNASVSALRFISPHGKALARRPLKLNEATPPDQATFAALLAECDRTPRTRAGLVVRFLAMTGLRITEARSLTWANVHHDRIEVAAEVSKGNRKRSVPRLAAIEETLWRLYALQTPGDFILPRETPTRAIVTACRTIGIRRLSFHSFRHLFATRCIESGVDLPTLARWLGHKDGGALAGRTYFHLLGGHSRQMAEKVRIL